MSRQSRAEQTDGTDKTIEEPGGLDVRERCMACRELIGSDKTEREVDVCALMLERTVIT